MLAITPARASRPCGASAPTAPLFFARELSALGVLQALGRRYQGLAETYRPIKETARSSTHQTPT